VRVLCLSRDEQIDLSIVDLRQAEVCLTVKSFYRTYGPIADFCLHPSKDYIFALSKHGFLYIFNIEDGDIRGKI
jgi:hypothetical protein